MGYRAVSALAIAVGALLLSSCGSRLPDQVFHVCLAAGEIDQAIVRDIRIAAEKHGLTFSDNGQSAKADLIKIDADDSAIPNGLPVFFDVQRGGRGILIGSNFGSQSEALRLSFFDADKEAEGFKSEVMRILGSLPDARVLPVDPDSEGPGPC